MDLICGEFAEQARLLRELFYRVGAELVLRMVSSNDLNSVISIIRLYTTFHFALHIPLLLKSH